MAYSYNQYTLYMQCSRLFVVLVQLKLRKKLFQMKLRKTTHQIDVIVRAVEFVEPFNYEHRFHQILTDFDRKFPNKVYV